MAGNWRASCIICITLATSILCCEWMPVTSRYLFTNSDSKHISITRASLHCMKFQNVGLIRVLLKNWHVLLRSNFVLSIFHTHTDMLNFSFFILFTSLVLMQTFNLACVVILHVLKKVLCLECLQHLMNLFWISSALFSRLVIA